MSFWTLERTKQCAISGVALILPNEIVCVEHIVDYKKKYPHGFERSRPLNSAEGFQTIAVSSSTTISTLPTNRMIRGRMRASE